MTVEVLAKKLNITQKKVQDLETMRNYGCFISIEDVAKFSDVLDVAPGYFFMKSNLDL